jgi:hypothetical protein
MRKLRRIKRLTTDKVLSLELKKPLITGVILSVGFGIGGILVSLLNLALYTVMPTLIFYILKLFGK